MNKYKLGDLLTVKHGWAFKGEYFSENGERSILTPGNFYEKGGFKKNDEKERYYLGDYPMEYLSHKGDLIVAMTEQATGLLGSTAIVPEDDRYLHNQRVGLITCNGKIDKFFAYYLFMTKSVRTQISRSSSGTKVKHTSPEKIYEVVVEIPSKDMQKKIANILWLIDSKVECNNSINDNLQQQIKLMYDYWFNQFDFPNEDGKPYRSSGGKMQYSQRFKRNIPDGWTEESVISNSISTPIKPGVEPFSTKTYLATADVNGARLSSGSLIDYETREGRANMQPTVSSVWFAKMKNSIKHLFLNKEMESLIDSTILSTGFCGLQCTNESFEYIASFIEHAYFEDVKNTLAHGATQESVNNDDLLGLTMLVPTPEVLELFHAKARPLYAQISQNICENQKLTEIRDWLLPMLMNGQATISD